MKKITKIILRFIIGISLIIILLNYFGLTRPNYCSEAYYDTPKYSFDKSINNEEDALLAFKEYTELEDITINDIEFKKIKFTTGDTIMAWVLKTKRIAIDVDGKLYEHVVCL